VTPANVTLAPGATQQFTATAQDQFHATLAGQTISWSAINGSISSTGQYTAPSSGTSDTVTASSGGVQGTANVTVSSPSSGVLFSDNFASGASQWTVHSGSYYLVTYPNGTRRLMVRNIGGVSRIVAGSSSWTNYSFQGILTLQNAYYGGGSASLLARVVDDNHLYFFGYDIADQAWMIARKDGANVSTILALGAPFTAQYNVDYQVQANLYGSSLSLYVNGVRQVSVTDSTYSSGKIGFSATYAQATLGNVVVTALSGPLMSRAMVGGGSAHGSSGVQSPAQPSVPFPRVVVTAFAPASQRLFSSALDVSGVWKTLETSLAAALGQPFWTIDGWF